MSTYGGAIATQAVGGILGIEATKINNAMAAQREADARRQNYTYSERAADAADARTRALYADLQSPAAMLQQYKEAGLSPSQMLAGSGAAGATPANGAQGGGAQGISPQIFGYNAEQFANMGLIAAQTKSLNAQAKKTEAEASTINGTNERGAAEIENLHATITEKTAQIGKIIAETHNLGLQAVFQEYQNSLAMLEVTYEASINEEKIHNYVRQCEYLKHQLRSIKVRANIDEATQKQAIQLIDEQVKNVIADTLLKGAQRALTNENLRLTNAQISDLISQINTRNEQVRINRDTLNQTINEWALKNGLINKGDINFGDLMLKAILGEKDGDSSQAIGTFMMLLKLLPK